MPCLCWARYGLYSLLLFGFLVFLSFQQTKNKISGITPVSRPGADLGKVEILGMDLDQPLREFIKEFNDYLKGYNHSTRLQNLFAAWGYVAAGLVSLVSLALSEGWI